MHYRGFTLDRFQTDAIGHLRDGRSVLVAAPTGTGKTIIADWVVDQALQTGRQVIYTAPIKALSNQKFRDYCKLHGEQNVGLVTGDLVVRREAPIRVMTTEILRNMLLGGEQFPDLMAVVLDEVHFLDDRERGTVWEEVLIYLPQPVLVVALSATLPNLEPFAEWLTFVRERPVEVITETTRAVPLSFHVATTGQDLMDPDSWEHWARKRVQSSEPVQDRSSRGRGGRKGRGRGRDSRSGGGRDRRDQRGRAPRTHPVDALRLVREHEGFPCLYFAFSRKDVERFAKALAFRFQADLLSPDEKEAVAAKLDADAEALGSALSDDLRDLYMRGIAFHHAGLHVQLKTLVEELYEARLLKVLFCTSTFALGINMPARTVVLHDLSAYDGESVKPLPTRGFMQIAGRAGRRGLDDAGQVVMRLDATDVDDAKPLFKRYSREIYEPVRSRFSLSWNSIVNLLERHDLDHIRTVVDKSFLSWSRSHQAADHVARADELEAAAEAGAAGKKALKEARRLRARASTANDACWSEFLRKRDYLQQVGYIGEDGAFKAGAKVLKHLQIAELFVTELVLEGVFDELDEATLFGVLCAITNDLPRAVDVDARPTRQERELARFIGQIRMGPVVTGAEAIANQELSWCPPLISLGQAWVAGWPLEKVLEMVRAPTDWSGSMVTGFRRAKDLLGQLRDVYAEMPDMSERLAALHKTVSRDEVEVIG